MRRFLTGAVRIGRARLGQTADEDVGRYRVRLDDVTGRYLEIRVRFKGACSSGQTPYLCNLVVYNDVGDMNNDQKANNFDTTPFMRAITATGPEYSLYYDNYPNCNRISADCNCDGAVNNFDITPYVSCLVAGGCGCP